MIFKEWITNNNNLYEPVKQKYPFCFEYLENRYQNLKLKYEPETFYLLLTAFLLDNKKELAKLETLQNLIITEDKLGKVNKTIDSSTGEFAGTNEVNYVGLNVEGTFNKNKATSNNSIKSDKSVYTVDLLSEIIKLNDTGLMNAFKQIDKEFKQLFILLYPVSF